LFGLNILVIILITMLKKKVWKYQT